MTRTTHLNTSVNQSFTFGKRILAGATLGLILISLFLLGAGTPGPAWGNFWRIRPLIIVPLAGATGGLCSYYITLLLNNNNFQKTLAIILSLLVLFIGLWLGTVLGLAGTYWH